MFDLMGPGPLMIPWTGLWDLAWQSPTTGFALLACLPTLLLTGFFLATREGHHYTAGAIGASPVVDRRQDEDRGDDRRRKGRGTVAA
jgi:hypothetical protein